MIQILSIEIAKPPIVNQLVWYQWRQKAFELYLAKCICIIRSNTLNNS